jgi:hypothetical protein
LQRAGEPSSGPGTAPVSPAAALGRLQLPSELPSPGGQAVDSFGNELRHGGG